MSSYDAYLEKRKKQLLKDEERLQTPSQERYLQEKQMP